MEIPFGKGSKFNNRLKFSLKFMLHKREKYCIIIHGDVFGIDDIFEIRIASGGILVGHLKKRENKVKR